MAAGCYVQTALDKTGKSVDADIILGTDRKGMLLQELETWFKERPDALSCVGDVMHAEGYEELKLPRIEGHTRAYIKVQDGCSQYCTYCIIPYARGRVRSRKEEDILKEIKSIVGI